MMDPYVPSPLSTIVIQTLVNECLHYKNPMQTFDDVSSRLLYHLVDCNTMFDQTLPASERFILMIITANSTNVDFYRVLLNPTIVLMSVNRIINVITTTIVNERVTYFFVDNEADSIRLKFSVYKTQQYRAQKIAISNLYNFPGSVFIVNDKFLFQFVFIIQEASEIAQVAFVFAAFRDGSSTWRTNHVRFDYGSGNLVARTSLGKILYLWNRDSFLFANNVFSLAYDPTNKLITGGIDDYLFRPISLLTCQICLSSGDTQYNAFEDSMSILLYSPLKKTYPIQCSERSGIITLYGFIAVNSEPNLGTILQFAQFQNQIESIIFILIRSVYTDDILPYEPIFTLDGLIIWGGDAGEFLIYKPTFPQFLARNSIINQGVSDLSG